MGNEEMVCQGGGGICAVSLPGRDAAETEPESFGCTEHTQEAFLGLPQLLCCPPLPSSALRSKRVFSASGEGRS